MKTKVVWLIMTLPILVAGENSGNGCRASNNGGNGIYYYKLQSNENLIGRGKLIIIN